MGKVETLRALVEEYVTHLDLWEKVRVEEVTRTTMYLPETLTQVDTYGIETTEVVYKEKETTPLPYVKVTYHTPKGKWKNVLHPNGFESREFPMEEVDRRIVHYRNKLYNLKKKADEQN